jgi:hypothetical protein
MPFHQADIIPIQQPVDLLSAERYDLVAPPRPAEFFFSETFVIEHKTVVLPIQALDLVAAAIGERIQSTVERVMAARPRKLFLKSTGSRYRKIFGIS